MTTFELYSVVTHSPTSADFPPEDEVNLKRRIDGIASREDFIAFVRELLRDLESDPGTWENRDLDSFLEALVLWTEDTEGYYRNVGGQYLSRPHGELLEKT